MDIKKSHWKSQEGRIELGLPITKVDQERRIVSGFATLDNLDSQNDIVLSEASKEAFSSFLGNVREMHDKIAAGRVVNFREQTYFDPETETVYEGIYVDVYVSKGAQSTWEKVLDGTLTGFSIGGVVTDQESIWDEKYQRFVNVIKKYFLVELSLVDSPANQLSNIFAVHKSSDGSTQVSGIAVGVETVDVFWCSDDNVATIGSDECMNCGNKSEKVGWIDSSLPAEEKSRAIAGLLKNTAKPAVKKEEGVTDKMADETVEKAETAEVAAEITEVVETVEDVVTEKSDTADTATAEATVSADEETVETPVESIDWQAELAALRETVTGITTALASVTKASEDTASAFNDISKQVEALATEVKDSITKNSETTEKAMGEIAERVSGVEKSIVTKKASDRTAATAAPAKKVDIWADRFTVPTN